VLVAPVQGGIRLMAVDAAAAAEGLAAGMTLGDARAVVPGLHAAAHDPAGDAAALAALAQWATRYSPLAATDGADGLVLDLTGCVHLFGDEAALLADVGGRLQRAGIEAACAIADTPAAAWAWARNGGGILAAGAAKTALAPLPLAALRLEEALVADLSLAGLRRIGDILGLPRAPLAARFGPQPWRRLDLALGRQAEPICPLLPVPAWHERLALAEPISRREDIETVARQLLERLCRRLEPAGLGARRLALRFHRVDATVQELAVGTGLPSRDPRHLLRLFREAFDGVAPGFGIEAALLAAPETDRLEAVQGGLDSPAAATGAEAVPRLLDTLQARLGRGRVSRLVPQDSHIPERGQTQRPAVLRRAGARTAGGEAAWLRHPARPLVLFHPPRAIEVVTPEQEDRPAVLRWQGRPHRVAAADGPERIDPEWWRTPGAPPGEWRDYYRIEDGEGRRYWIFRLGDRQPPRWYLHGLFA
jgi:protein ImuB